MYNLIAKIIFCILSDSLIANNQVISKQRQPPSGPSPSSFVCPSAYGYFQNPDNCNTYYYCWAGSSYLQFCPDGAIFSPINHNCSITYSCSPSTPSSLETDSSNFIPSEYPPARPHSTFRPWSQSTPFPGANGGFGGVGPNGQDGYGGYNGNNPYPSFPIVPNAGTGCYQECCTYRSVLVRSVCSITKNLINVSLRKFTRVRGNIADAARRIGLTSSSEN